MPHLKFPPGKGLQFYVSDETTRVSRHPLIRRASDTPNDLITAIPTLNSVPQAPLPLTMCSNIQPTLTRARLGRLIKRSSGLLNQPLVVAAIAIVAFATVSIVLFCTFRAWKRRRRPVSHLIPPPTREEYVRRQPSCSSLSPCARCRVLYMQDQHLEAITIL